MQSPEETLTQIYNACDSLSTVEEAIDDLDSSLEIIDIENGEYFDRFEDDMENLKLALARIIKGLNTYETQVIEQLQEK